MTRSALILLSALFVLSVPLIRCDAGVEPSPVRAKILTDVSAIKPGSAFELAVLFEMDPDWHIYWKNPGDSGLPTSVEFGLPEGFEVGDIKWPVPSLLKGAGNLTDYGYEDTLLLSARVTAPFGLKSGSTVTLAAKVSWISCKDICIPGKTELQLKLPVSDKPVRVNSDLFTSWRPRLPVSYPAAGLPFKIGVKTANKSENEFTVSLLLKNVDGVSGIDLYPIPGNSFLVDHIVVEKSKTGGETSVNFDVKRLVSKVPAPGELETLIVYKDKTGNRSGVVFPIKIRNAE